MSLLRQPGWLRGWEIATGVLALIFAIIVFAIPGYGIAFLIVLLSVALIFTGVRSLTIAGLSRLSRGLRTLSVISGMISLFFAILVIVYPGYGAASLLVLLSFGLVIYGLSRIAVSYMLDVLSTGLRALIAVIGVLDIVLSAVVLAYPSLALLTLAALLGIALLFSGVEMIISGAVGRTWLGNIVHDVQKAT